MQNILEKKGFSMRDIVYIVTIVAGFIAGYYTVNDRIGDGETERKKLIERVITLEESGKAYASLPADVEKMQKDMEKNAKKTNAIYYGLLSKGIINPSQ